MLRMTRQGFPAANTPSGTSRVTTLPAPITVREPMRTPGRMIAPPPTHTSVADLDRLAVLLAAPERGVERVHRRCRSAPRGRRARSPDADQADVEHDAVEVEEDPLAELDVGAVVAEEGRLHPDAVAAPAEESPEDVAPRVGLRLAGGVQRLAEVAGALAPRGQLGIEGSYSSPASIFSRSVGRLTPPSSNRTSSRAQRGTFSNGSGTRGQGPSLRSG